ncbi:pyridoxamine 5'-phosphate oxidase family protein [Aeromicrobium sp. 179-A 4D2 NHS]|uniref:pyridoxamine 5'-phosphate oxidase family protein n=1 Tax=Aeromicrobium sp. 179-A 4D2 NHS TaxID=3142375 RepID=UPI00399FEC5D
MTDVWLPEGDFLTDRHLATLSTMGPSGRIHVVAVGFTVFEGIVRITTMDGSQKVRNVERDPRATVAQVAGPQWVSIAGTAEILRDRESVALAERLYAERYRQPKENPRRVVIAITPEKVMCSPGLRGQAPAHD